MSCNCNKPKCDGKCGISPSVLQINNPGDCTLFHRVEVPASMGDSTTNPPKNGDYRNVLLYYVADGTSWLFSSDGIPQKLVSGFTDYEDAINLPQINGETLIGDKSGAELGLQNQLIAGDNIQIAADGKTISATDTTYGPATDDTIGLVKPGEGLHVSNDGTMTVPDIALINSEKTVFVGDSYAVGANPESDTLTPWPEIVASLMGLSSAQYDIVAEAGAGFMRTGTAGHTFLTKLQAEIDNITDKNLVKNIILCGGYNDNSYDLEDIVSAINTFVAYCHTHFPNATVYIGEIAYRYQIADAGAQLRDKLASKVYPAYAGNVKTSFTTAKYVYLNGVENILKGLPKTYMYENNAHPNQDGQNALGRGIYQAFMTGKCSSYASGNMSVSNSEATTCSGTIALKHCNDQCEIVVTNLEVLWPTGTKSITSNGNPVTICNYSANGFIGGCSNSHNTMPCLISIQDYDKGRHTMCGYLQFATDGTVKIGLWDTATTTSTGTTVNFSNVKQVNIFRSKLVIPDLLA